MDPRKLLRPWRTAFRRLRAVEDEYYNDTDVLWLDFGNYGRTNHVVGLTMEGLELLLWLARVSVDDFQDVVDELWPEQVSLEGETSYRSLRCKQIGIRLRMDTYSYLAGLGHTSQNLTAPAASHEYVEARGAIQQVLRERGESDAVSRQKPTIVVSLLRRTGFKSFGDSELKAIESIGLALFSSLARHSIESVTLDFHTDAVLLQRLLQALGRADDPLAIILNDHAASIRAYQHMRATASRFSLYDPMAHAKNKNVVVDTHEHKELRIIDYKRPWWCVLLPAWDEAWVHDDDATVTTVSSVSVSQVGNPNIRKISVASDQTQVADFVALVKVMNPSVEDLTLYVDVFTGYAESSCANVVSSFPNLRRLSLDVSSHHLASLVSGITSLGEDRSLATLALVVHFERDEYHLLRDLIEVLADPSHAVSQCLDELVLKAHVTVGSDVIDELTRRLGDILHVNKRLVTLRFTGGMTRVNEASSKALEQALLAHHGSFVSGFAASLGCRQKLAFLSTMQSAYRRGGTSSLQLLDSETISIVFGFAARSRRRTVTVHHFWK